MFIAAEAKRIQEENIKKLEADKSTLIVHFINN
jgi:hypothetical protein